DHVPEPRADEGLALARLHELMLDEDVGLPFEDDLEAFSDVGGVSHGSSLVFGRDLPTDDDVRARLIGGLFAFGGDLEQERSVGDRSADPPLALHGISLDHAEDARFAGWPGDPREEARGVGVDLLR